MPTPEDVLPTSLPPVGAGELPAPVRVIAVAGGKGGVGKTTVAINLALALIDSGHRALVLDTDLSLGNVDVMLGLTPHFTLADVFAGRCTLAETIITGPRGLLVVPASSGKRHMTELRPAEYAGLIHAFSELRQPLDTMIIDTATGISDSVLTFIQAAQDVIVTLCNEPASMADAYALIRILAQERGVKRVHVLANMTRSATEGREMFRALARTSERCLNVVLDYAGAIPCDEWVRRAIQRQQAVVDAFPASAAAAAFHALARCTEQWEAPAGPRGGVEFFVERLVASGVAI